MSAAAWDEELHGLYFPTAGKIVEVDVPALNFAAVDGRGDPNTSPQYREALEALFGVSYTAKFALKREGVADYRVPPLESLWWSDAGEFFPGSDKASWSWTAMILQPAVVARPRFESALTDLKARKNPPALSKLRFRRFLEGPAVQTLFVGPYSAEGPTIERLRLYIEEHGHRARGKHHEIYLGDPRRSAPERLRTVIRQPFAR